MKGEFVMSNQLYKLGICLLLCGLLAGCGSSECQHQWGEADCTNPGSCSLCGDVQSEALGHDWTAATCASPETCSRCGEVQGEAAGHNWIPATCKSPEHCSRCGETQGDALPHSFGSWTLSGEEMFRQCSVCEAGESQAVDYALYMKDELVGHWNLAYVVRNGNIYYPHNLSSGLPDAELIFRPDGGISTGGYEETDTGEVWVFDRGEYNSESDEHTIYIRTGKTEAEAANELLFSYIDGSLLYINPEKNGDIVVLSKDHGAFVAPLLVGDWAAYSVDSVYSIHLSEDRSFTADIDGEISGFWQPRPLDYNGGTFYSGDILLNYCKDGKNKTVSAVLNGINMDQSQQLRESNLNLMADINDEWMIFQPGSGEKLKEMAEKADTVPLGDWTSTEYMISYPGALVDGEYVQGEEETGPSTDFSITFSGDGSFRAKLHEECEGTWTLRRIEISGEQVRWNYSISMPGADDASYFDVSADGRGYLYIYNGSETFYYNFRQMNEEELAAQTQRMEAAPTMVVGSWYDADSTGVEMAFREDGTFLLQFSDGRQQEGLWHFWSMDEYDGRFFYYYSLETDYETHYKTVFGEEFDTSELMAEIPIDEETGEPEKYLEEHAVILTDENGTYRLDLNSYLGSLTMVNADGVAAAEDAAALLLGHWSCDVASEYDAVTKESTEITGEFYLDFAEDGTLTGRIVQDVQGTWNYYNTENGALRYLLYFDGKDMGSMFTLKDGTLVGSCTPYIVELRQ